jgi:hypothetical protein
MHIHISFADQDTYSLQAYGRSMRRSMAALRMLMALLFILLAALLAIWVAGPEIRVGADWNGVAVSGHLNATEAPVPIARPNPRPLPPRGRTRFPIPIPGLRTLLPTPMNPWLSPPAP